MLWELLRIPDSPESHVLLASADRLSDMRAYEIVDGNKERWVPHWGSRVDTAVNSQFITAISDRVYNNEKVSDERDKQC